ncbi:MAG: chemotaxis protein CheX [Bacteriovoracaceae bacterium]
MDFNDRFLGFSKPFIDGVKEVYSTMMSTEIQNDKPEIKQNPTSKGFYSSIIGMNGVLEVDGNSKQFQGSMSITWEKEAYLKTAGQMLMEEYTEFNEEIQDAGAEIVNIVMGNAKKVLAEEGYKIEMSTPTVVTGEDHELGYQKCVITIATPFESELGKFWLEIGYRDQDQS